MEKYGNIEKHVIKVKSYDEIVHDKIKHLDLAVYYSYKILLSPYLFMLF